VTGGLNVQVECHFAEHSQTVATVLCPPTAVVSQCCVCCCARVGQRQMHSTCASRPTS